MENQCEIARRFLFPYNIFRTVADFDLQRLHVAGGAVYRDVFEIHVADSLLAACGANPRARRESSVLGRNGDVFEVKAGDRLYTSVLRGDKQGTMTVEVTVGKDISSGSTAHFAGEYVVVKARKSGGGYGHGPVDYYPDGHEVTAKKLNGGKYDPDPYRLHDTDDIYLYEKTGDPHGR